MNKEHLPFKNKPNCSSWLQVITIPPFDSWTLQMGIFHGEKRDHYFWVTGKAQLQEPGEHWSFDEGDSLLFWRLAEQCWCLEWKSAIKQLSAVPHTCPAWKCSTKAAFQGQFLHEQSGSVLDEGRAPWCSCTPRFWFQAQQGCSQPALLPFLPPLSCWSWVDLFLLLVGGFEKWNSTGGGIATGNPFIIISWCKKTVFKLNIFFKNKASGGALIPVFGIIFNFNKTSQQLFIKFFSWRNLFSMYIQKTELATLGQMWYLGKKKRLGQALLVPRKVSAGAREQWWQSGMHSRVTERAKSNQQGEVKLIWVLFFDLSAFTSASHSCSSWMSHTGCSSPWSPMAALLMAHDMGKCWYTVPGEAK